MLEIVLKVQPGKSENESAQWEKQEEQVDVCKADNKLEDYFTKIVY